MSSSTAVSIFCRIAFLSFSSSVSCCIAFSSIRRMALSSFSLSSVLPFSAASSCSSFLRIDVSSLRISSLVLFVPAASSPSSFFRIDVSSLCISSLLALVPAASSSSSFFCIALASLCMSSLLSLVPAASPSSSFLRIALSSLCFSSSLSPFPAVFSAASSCCAASSSSCCAAFSSSCCASFSSSCRIHNPSFFSSSLPSTCVAVSSFSSFSCSSSSCRFTGASIPCANQVLRSFSFASVLSWMNASVMLQILTHGILSKFPASTCGWIMPNTPVSLQIVVPPASRAPSRSSHSRAARASVQAAKSRMGVGAIASGGADTDWLPKQHCGFALA
mmetsp:Transcript_97049/g.224979  ORF Transcript_97049/g.224979 Transcript_97049/m.224979 type:complete len:333 (-) Transcript_97049:8-1006(-)